MKKLLALIIAICISLSPMLTYGLLGDNPLDPPQQPGILSVTATPTSHTSGSVATTTISVSTKNVPEGTAITAELMDSTGLIAVQGVSPAAGTVKSNSAVLSLSIPAGIGAGSYKIKASMSALNISDTSLGYTINAAAAPSITSVQASQTSHVSGTQQSVTVDINTSNVSNGTTATVQLVKTDGSSVTGVNSATGNVNNNTANVTLSIPGSVGAGSYKIKVTVSTATDSNTAYTINSQSNTAAISSVTASPTSQYDNQTKQVSVTVSTSYVQDNTSITVDLVKASDLSDVSVVTDSIGTITNNAATVQLTIPSGITAGSYRIRVLVTGISTANTTTPYTINSAASITPMVTNISTSSTFVQGSIASDSTITIMGSNFSATASENSVQIIDANGSNVDTPITPSSASATQLTVPIPTNLQAGTYRVKVALTTNNNSTTSTVSFKVDATLPVISSINTSGAVLTEGFVSGSIVISGSNFPSPLQANYVKIVNSSNVEIASATVTVSSNTSITITLPTLTQGTYKVKVGSVVSSSSFTVIPGPKITGVSASTGATLVAGHISGNIMIEGTGFSSTLSGNTVKYKNTTTGAETFPATISSVTDISITAAIDPGLAAGTYSVKVIANDGYAISSQTFTVAPAPSITSISTSGATLKAGAISGNIIIYGTGFSSTTDLNLVEIVDSSTLAKAATATINSASTTSINAIIPNLSAGTYKVKVTVSKISSISSDTFIIAEADAIIPSGGIPSGTTSGEALPDPEDDSEKELDEAPSVVDPDKIAGDANKSAIEIANEKDPVKAQEKAIEVIKNTADDVKALIASGVSTTEVEKALQNVAASALDKINDITVKAQEANGVSKTVITKEDSEKIILQMDALAKAAKELNDQLVEGSAGLRVQSVLQINLEGKNTKQVETVIPSEVLTSAATKKIDLIQINTGVATIAIAPDSIAVPASSSVSLSAKKLDSSELSKEVKAAAGSNTVYDFNLLAGSTKITTFKKLVEVSVPYVLKAGEKADKVTVYYIADDGKLQNVIGMYDENTKTVKFKTSHFSKYAVVYKNVTFKDLGNVQWAKDYIEALASKGIAGGTGKGNYKPVDSITRSQFVALVVRALGLKDDKAACNFKDVKNTHILYKEIASAYKLGLLVEKSGSSFSPDQYITREEMAKIIGNVLNKQKGKELPAIDSKYIDNFKDKAEISAAAKQSVALANKYGILQGSSGIYNPKGMTSRAAAAKVVYLLLKLN